jgi:1,4-dihydroxy-2-naphthoate polyprenyltransferase
MTQTISKSQAWILAARPKTLPAASVAVLVGSALAIRDQKFSFTASLFCLLCSFLIQIGTNFANDLFDHLKGSDTPDRVGPMRLLSSGHITPSEMKIALWITFGLAFILGMYLVYLGGILVLIIGVLSIISGIIYTAGPYPLAYNGLGDVFSFVFFGIVGTMGTYFVNTHEITLQAFIASIPVGALVTAILVVNNYRDIDQDRVANKNTLAVIFGKKFSRIEYKLFIFAAFLVPLILFVNYNYSLWVFLPVVLMPLAIKLITLLSSLEGQELNRLLALTAAFSSLYGFLLAVGIAL